MAGIEYSKLVCLFGDFHFGELPLPPLAEKRSVTQIDLPASRSEPRTKRLRTRSPSPQPRIPTWGGPHERRNDQTTWDPSAHIFVDSPIQHDKGGLPAWSHTHPAEKVIYKFTDMLLTKTTDVVEALERCMAREPIGRSRDNEVTLRAIQEGSLPPPPWAVDGDEPDLVPMETSQTPQSPRESELFFSPTSAWPVEATDEAPTVNSLRVPRRIAGTVSRLSEMEKQRKRIAKHTPSADMFNPYLYKRHEDVVIDAWRSLQRMGKLKNLVESRPLELLRAWLHMRWRHLVAQDLVDGWPSEELPYGMFFSADSTGAELAEAFETAMMSSSLHVIDDVMEGFANVREELGNSWLDPDMPETKVPAPQDCKENVPPEGYKAVRAEACLFGPLYDSTNRMRDWTGLRGGEVIVRS